MSSSPTNRTGIFNNSTAESPQPSTIVRSDFVVIMAALLCALICVIGLITATRCSCIFRGGNNFSSQGNKGVKKKILRSLPKLNYEDSMKGVVVDCVICLSEFINGDEIRILPQCGHGFHVGCIDTWLGSHSSCPSCRQILVFSRCQKCGGVPGSSGSEIQSEIEMKAREDDVNQFMP